MNRVNIIKVEDAVGQVLCHDLTQIIVGEKKGPRFKKGHIITEEDIPILLSMGKEHIYVLELDYNTFHENEAADHLANICSGENILRSEVSEGKINLISSVDGLLKVNVDLLNKINSCDEVMIATKFNNTVVNKGDIVAGTRAIPLFIEKNKIYKCESIANLEKILNIKPFIRQKVAIITTGNEVYYNRVKDGFKKVLENKLLKYKFDIIEHRYSKDGIDEISRNIEEVLKLNVDLILCTGGMSVDPDDNTPGAIKKVSTKVISYGTPVLPGAMFMVSYFNNTAILGLPGSVMYCDKTVFDLLIPRIAVKENITRLDIVALGHGGLI